MYRDTPIWYYRYSKYPSGTTLAPGISPGNQPLRYQPPPAASPPPPRPPANRDRAGARAGVDSLRKRHDMARYAKAKPIHHDTPIRYTDTLIRRKMPFNENAKTKRKENICINNEMTPTRWNRRSSPKSKSLESTHHAGRVGNMSQTLHIKQTLNINQTPTIKQTLKIKHALVNTLDIKQH